MKENFWHQKWELGDIAFHENKVNPFLILDVQVFGSLICTN